MKYASAALALLLLSACVPSMPDSGAGSSWELRRQQQQAADDAYRQGLDPRISTETVTTAAVPDLGTPSGGSSGADLAAETRAALNATAPAGSAPLPPAQSAPVPSQTPQPQTSMATPLPDGTQPTGMSDEQDFGAVASRETIESDRERLAANRAAYQEVQPAPLPPRSGASDTMVVDFALSTTNSVGQQIYKRSGGSQSRFLRACAKYGAQDAAQEDFLRSGGPERDGKGLDPDGDGFACFWDPAPFRNARLGAVAPPQAREVIPPGDASAAGGN